MLQSAKNTVLARFSFRSRRPVVPIVRLSGAIGLSAPGQAKLALETVNADLERAFGKKTNAAVALAINSPGGSPVQSALIHERIRQLAGETGIPVLAFCEDAAASGGYMLAAAGDEIFAHASSIIGSIGVVSAGFGFVGALDKLGIERRVHTAGENKSILDPFKAEKPEDVERLKAIQLDIHDQFKDMVKHRRGEKLKADAPDLFTGAFWTGQKALDLGLIDGLGTLHTTVRERFGDKVKLKMITRTNTMSLRRLIASSRTGGGDDVLAGLGSRMTVEALEALEAHALWQRHGL